MLSDGVRGPVSGRDRRLRQFRLLDVLLALGLTLGFVLLSRVLPFWKSFAVFNAAIIPLFMWLSWRQYSILDEYAQAQLLKAYAVAGITTLGAVFGLVAWCAWMATTIDFTLALAGLYGALMVGWVASWATWLWLRWGGRE
jgi:hypothetical protein